jgi:probable phosphoglycerate mutase
MTATHIHLVRHGEVHNPENILYGRLPRFSLSVEGRQQARRTGRYLQSLKLAALYSSPMLRARQTAREISYRQQGLKLHLSKDLNEVWSPYEGRPGTEVDARSGDVYTGCPAGFEQPWDLVARAKAFCTRALKRHPGRHVVAVTHGDIIVFSALWALGAAVTPANKTRLIPAGFPVGYPEHASITTLMFERETMEDRPRVAYLNPNSSYPGNTTR